jgi:hypothetical protein
MMSAPPRNSDTKLTRRDEMNVSGGALADVPWQIAGAAGVVVTGADLLLHLTTGHLAVGSSLSAGVLALFAVAGAGLMLRKRGGRAAQWARRNPWRFAIVPGAATAIVVFVLSVVLGSSGMIGGTFTSLWHGAVAYGVTGIAGAAVSSRRSKTS